MWPFPWRPRAQILSQNVLFYLFSQVSDLQVRFSFNNSPVPYYVQLAKRKKGLNRISDI